jgi:hypothetical protein
VRNVGNEGMIQWSTITINHSPSNPHSHPFPTKHQKVIAVSGMDHDLPFDAARSGSDGWFAHPRVPAHGNARIVAERHERQKLDRKLPHWLMSEKWREATLWFLATRTFLDFRSSSMVLGKCIPILLQFLLWHGACEKNEYMNYCKWTKWIDRLD